MAPRPEPAGFGNCKFCAYRESGTAAICFACAGQGMVRPENDTHCDTCCQALPASGNCSNWLCHSPDRQFRANFSIAMKTGPLERAILAWKDRGTYGWGVIFARVVLGVLQETDGDHGFDAIIPMPAFTLPHAKPYEDHASYVIRMAADEDETGIPFVTDPPLIVKTGQTPKMRGKKLADRKAIALQLRGVLQVPDPARVRGLHILVYDDVFTDGSTLNEVARALRAAGAASVSGLTLARQTWQDKTI